MTRRAIKFSRTYRKMRGILFTTVRRWTEQKESYYRGLRGRTLDVVVEGRPFPVGRAVLVSLDRCQVKDMAEDFLAYDTDNGRYQLDRAMGALILTFMWEGGEVPDNL